MSDSDSNELNLKQEKMREYHRQYMQERYKTKGEEDKRYKKNAYYCKKYGLPMDTFGEYSKDAYEFMRLLNALPNTITVDILKQKGYC